MNETADFIFKFRLSLRLGFRGTVYRLTLINIPAKFISNDILLSSILVERHNPDPS